MRRVKKAFRIVFAMVAFLVLAVGFGLPLPSVLAATTQPPTTTINGVTWVQVSSAAELEYIDQNPSSYQNSNIMQTANIRLSGYTWTPLNFGGTFNGNGYSIGNLSTTFGGMFDTVTTSGVVKNFSLWGATVSGPSGLPVGGLAAINQGVIQSSYVAGNVYGTNATGGMVGENSGYITESNFLSGNVTATASGSNATGGLVGVNLGVINNSGTSAPVSGYNNIGGFVGINAGLVDNSYSFGQVKQLGASTNVGGFVGYNSQAGIDVNGTVTSDSEGTIQDCYTIGGVIQSSTGTDNGGFVGWEGAGASINDSYWNTDAGGSAGSGGGATTPTLYGVSDSSMSIPATFAGWDFTNIWQCASSSCNGWQAGNGDPNLRYSTNPTNGSVQLSTVHTGATSNDTLGFTSSKALSGGTDTLSLLSDGATLPSTPSSYVLTDKTTGAIATVTTVQTVQAEEAVTGPGNPNVQFVYPSDLLVVLTVPENINAGDQLSLAISGTTNPSSQGTYSIGVSTTIQTLPAFATYRVVAPPTITGVSPGAGPRSGGTSVTIQGTNLSNATSVTIGGLNATVTGDTYDSITATTPGGMAGPADVVVTTAGGTATDTGGFTYLNPPMITTLSPTEGPTAGGTSLTIQGYNLANASVTIGGASASMGSDSATSITVTTPPGTVGAADVMVTTAGGTATGTVGFTYLAPPTITSVSPGAGPTAGGTTVTIQGTNLANSPSVTIGGANATLINYSATSITVTTPPGTVGAANVVVTTTGGSATDSGAFTYATPPTITDLSPGAGPTTGGTSVTIQGTNLSNATSVTIGGTGATIGTDNSTSITVTTPSETAGAADVVVKTSGGTVTDTGGFTYMAAPTITSVSPSSGSTAGGTSVTIQGTNLSNATSVTIGGTGATIGTDNSTSITVTTPSGTAGAADVVVKTSGGTVTDSGGFTYLAAPTITSVSPSNGPTTGGPTVTIQGTDLANATSVTIGGTGATIGTDNSTSITVTTPSGTAGAADVVVKTSGGTVTDTGGFTYMAAPTITGVTPSSGPAAGGTSVTIQGTNLSNAISVTIGGTGATIGTDNSTSITVTTPSGTAGAADVVVKTSGGTVTDTGGFTYMAAPTITGVTPSSGPAAGGTSVTIQGTNLSNATSVTIGGTGATIGTDNSTSITVTTPSGTAGAADVVVKTSGGTVTDAGGFTYMAAPTITSVSPSSGPAAGGTSVTIQGTNLSNATSVTIGGTGATIGTDNSTSITVTTPSGTAGAATVVVKTAGGPATDSGGFTYVAAPTITSVSPSSGLAAGGTSVTIQGTNLSNATSVTIGGTGATIGTDNSTSITVTTPSGTAGAADVVVKTSGGTVTDTGGFTYMAAPTITGVTPSSGPAAGGTSVTIQGTNLSNATSVTIGGANATIGTDTSTSITVTTPSGTAGAADVVVKTSGGTVTDTGGFTYMAAPTITGVTPNSGPAAGGTSVTIQGTNLANATFVTIGGANATIGTDNSTSITVTTPPGTAGAATVVVKTAGGSATDTGGFTYTAAPTITSVSPSSGPAAGGTSVTIQGTNLSNATSVTIGGTNATIGTDTSTGLTVTTPSGTAGAADVVVKTAGGSATDTGGFTYTAAPTITSVSPSSGPISGGTTVTIQGTDLANATFVTIGGANATIGTDNSTSITGTTPPGTAGAAAVVVKTSGGTVTDTGGFTYMVAPTITGVSPSSGPISGGTTVTIHGTDLANATSVTIGGASATIDTDSSTSITVTTPSGTAGAAAVAVKTAGGTVTDTGAFTYEAAPTISGVSPSSGPTTGGTSVTIGGSNLGVTSAVYFGTSRGTIAANSNNRITVTTPAGTGTVAVSVYTPGGSAILANAFTYTNLPTLIAVSPSSGPVSGGTSVTITGSNLNVATAVYFGTRLGTITSNGDYSITVTTPAGNGTVAVTVYTPDGDAVLANGFTYQSGAFVGGGGGRVVFPKSKSVAREIPSYTDVPTDYWAYQAIEQLTFRGIVKGFPNGTFRPNDTVTRAQFVTELVRLLGLSLGSGNTTFSDVPRSAWYEPYVRAGEQAGIVQGESSTIFDPNGPVTREEMAVMLARALNLTGSTNLTFSDTSQVSTWAIRGIEAVVKAGYLKGMPGNLLDPLSSSTRAQVAEMLYRYLVANPNS